MECAKQCHTVHPHQPPALSILQVYEHLIHSGGVHRSLRTFPGMASRSLRLGSAGKTFSYTAWKVGWISGPAALLSVVVKAHQSIVFTVASSLQRAVAFGLDKEEQFYRCVRVYV